MLVMEGEDGRFGGDGTKRRRMSLRWRKGEVNWVDSGLGRWVLGRMAKRIRS